MDAPRRARIENLCIPGGLLVLLAAFALLGLLLGGCSGPSGRSATRAAGPTTTVDSDEFLAQPSTRRSVTVRVRPIAPPAAPATAPAVTPAEPAPASPASPTPATPHAALVSFLAASALSVAEPEDEIAAAVSALLRTGEVEVEIETQDETRGGLASRTAAFTQSGPELTAQSDDAIANFAATTSPFRLMPGGWELGEGKSRLASEVFGQGGPNVLHLMGGACIVAAAVSLLIPPRSLRTAGVLFAGGLALVAVGTAIDEVPWLVWGGGAVVLAVAAYAVYAGHVAKARAIALDSSVRAIESAGDIAPELKRAVRFNGAKQASVVRGAVRASKRRTGVDTAPPPPIKFAAEERLAEMIASR